METNLELWQILLLALVGVISGWVNVMAGGGSMLTVPAMVFMGIPAPAANGTNRIGIFLQNVFAVAAFFRKGFSDFRLSLSLSAAACLGAVFGARMGTQLDGVWFNRVLAITMLGIMLSMALGKGKKAAPPTTNRTTRGRLWLGHALMIGAGVWGGFIQIGVGFILMPILHRVLGMDLVRVNMHKVFIILMFTIVALLIFSIQVKIVWMAGLALAVGASIGGWIGAHSTINHGEVWIKRTLYAAITLIVIKLLIP